MSPPAGLVICGFESLGLDSIVVPDVVAAGAEVGVVSAVAVAEMYAGDGGVDIDGDGDGDEDDDDDDDEESESESATEEFKLVVAIVEPIVPQKNTPDRRSGRSQTYTVSTVIDCRRRNEDSLDSPRTTPRRRSISRPRSSGSSSISFRSGHTPGESSSPMDRTARKSAGEHSVDSTLTSLT